MLGTCQLRPYQFVLESTYLLDDGDHDRIKERKKYPLFASMSHELKLSIADGIKIYVNHREVYFSILKEGIEYIQRAFSWERAAQEYIRYIM